MKEITLKIPDKKLKFFLELVKQLGFDVSHQVDISEEHKAIVRDRIKTTGSNDMIPWDKARKQLTFKSK